MTTQTLVPHIFPVTCSTQRVGKGSIFIAIPGYRNNGCLFIEEAIKKGATKIIAPTSEQESLQKLITQNPTIEFVFVDAIRKKMAELAAKAADYPADKLKIIGITGTKGKSTTTHLINHLLQAAGYKTALIGGIKNSINNIVEKSSLTTPDSDYLQQFLATCVSNNIDYVIMEVSSHALSLDRVYGIKFAHIGFTNFAAEHLDFYTTLEAYFAAKCLIFKQIKDNGTIHINSNNQWGLKALTLIPESINVNTFEEKKLTRKKNTGIHFVLNNNPKSQGLHVTITTPTTSCTLESPFLFGEFNAYNVTMAFSIALTIGIPLQRIKQALTSFPGTPGRLQLHTLHNGARAFVDYAHNPSSMEAVLKALRPLTKHLIIIFGCGGDRDTTKRPIMGALAAQYGDIVIITNDNPRTESPQTIIDQIYSGINLLDKEKTYCIQDRSLAITYAAEHATSSSIIALLGKGHENYYIIGNKTFYFDDYEAIKQF